MKQVAVITGAANGIGAATARRMLADGYEVVGLDREPGAIEGVTFYEFDVTRTAEIDALLDRIEDKHGKITAFANIAGAAAPTTMSTITPEALQRHMAIFVEGAIFLSISAGNRMADNGGGRIVNVSSTGATAAMPSFLAYNAAKGALDAASRTLAQELAPRNVLLNVVAPGFVRTRMSNLEDGVNEADTEEFKTDFVNNGRLPIARTAEPSEVAEPIAFLLSERNTYISGATLVVDGGLTSTM
ncbi:SDR family NAD(P)-dependent oxidoreductase [Paenarthrobacter sp. NPDC058040]|uniref:SDR family NAD(P)-dependent oxidoreductase n=1 Tax=unclassified Paenarthrobacter TaxID=2634190 RepID=UPI0036DB9861